MACRTCGETMEGDGYTRVRHCPNAPEFKTDHAEPDANPIHCTEEDQHWIERLNDLEPKPCE